MKQKNIIVPKTARYFTLGDATAQTEEVWFVCHGYAQLANYFLKNFAVLDTGKNLIVAPEGLHRFYWKGFSDRVVASWMTKEDREHDIHDYVNFLDNVYNEVMSVFTGRKVKVNVLGFSQGTATVCRWLANGNVHVNNLVLWAGAFPEDMDFVTNKALFDSINAFVVVGDSDEFMDEAGVQKHAELLKKSDIRYELVRFVGKHEMNEAVLIDLQKRF